MNMFFKLSIVILLTLFTNLSASQDQVKDIAKISASALYNIDKTSLQKTMDAYIQTNPKLLGLKIVEVLSGETYYQMYKENDNIHFNKLFPKNIKEHKSFTTESKYENETVGKITAYFENENFIELTKEEKSWIKNNVVKVGVEQWSPVTFSNTGKDIDGITGDVLKLIMQRTGLKIEVENDLWAPLLKGLENKRIDILPATYYTDKRATYGLFSSDYFKMNDAIYIKENNTKVTSMKDLNGKKLAIVKGYGTIPKVKKQFPNINIIQTIDLKDSINKVLKGEVDALYEGQVAVEHMLQDQLIVGLKGITQDSFDAAKLHFFTRDDKPVLHSIIQKGLNTISYEEKRKIISKWIGNKKNKNTFFDKLTKKEKKYLKNNKELNIISGPAWPPFDYIDKKNHEHYGIGHDYFQEISKITGITFNHIHPQSWSDAMNKIKNKETDIFTIAKQTPKRDKFLNFTDTFITYPIVISTLNTAPFIASVSDFKNEKIALIKDFAITEILKNDYPNLNVVLVKNIKEGLELVSNGKAYAFLGSLGAMSYTIKEEGFFNLKIAGVTKYKFSWGAAIRKDISPELLSIINKALAYMPIETKNNIYNKWVSLEFDEHIDYTIIYQIIGVFLLFIIGALYWNRKLSLAKDIIHEQQKQFTSMVSNVPGVIYRYVLDDKNTVLFLSDEIENLSGYAKDVFLNNSMQTFVDIVHPDDVEHALSCVEEQTNNEKQYNIEYRIITKNGDIQWIRDQAQVLYSNDKTETWIDGVMFDITAQKELENKIKESQEQFSTMVSNVPGAIYRAVDDSAWPIIYMSDEIEKITGYPASDFMESKIVTFSTIMYPDDVEPMGKIITDQFAKGKNFQIDYRVIAKNGDIKWVRSQGQSVKTHSGEAFIDGVLIDITEAKEAEAKIELLSELVYGSLKSASVGAWWVDFREEDTFHALKNTAEMIGIDFKSENSDACVISEWGNVLQNTATLSDEYKKAIDNTFENFTGAISGKYQSYHAVYPIAYSNGEVRWIEARADVPKRDKNGNALLMTGTLIDITESRKAQEDIKEQSIFIDSIMNTQDNFVLTSDGETLKTANKAFFEFYDVQDEEEFIEKFGDCICDTFDTDAPKEYIQKFMGDEVWLDYIYNRPNQVHKTMIIKDNKEYIFTITTDKLIFKDEELKTAVLTDITELERIRKDIELILSNILLPILITSKKDRKILYANKYAQRQYEKPLEDIIGSDIDEVYTVVNQHEHILQELQEKGYIENSEEIFKTHTGKEFNALLSVTPLLYKDQDAYIGMVVDITKQKEIESQIREIHKHTKDSIKYASSIQQAIVPDNNVFYNYFDDFFTIWQPKDIVGGDIYLFEDLNREDRECLLMVIDCTGHGVPGAFVTMLVKALERQVIAKINNDRYGDIDVSPAWILQYFNKNMKKLLKQETKESISNAGFDGQVIYYNKSKNIFKCASARNEIFYIQNEELVTIKPDKQSIGYRDSNSDFEFKDTVLNIEENMSFYIATDGYWDQNGGDKEFCYGKRRLKSLILDSFSKPMSEQKNILVDSLIQYQGECERNDDVTFVGISVSKQEEVLKDDIIISISGIISQQTIDSLLNDLEIKFKELDGGARIASKISYMAIEQLQNILHYSSKKNINSETKYISQGKFTIGYNKSKSKYYVSSSNEIEEDDKIKISEKLDYVNSLDAIGVKKYYKELLRNESAKHDKGAGIGIVDMARKSSEKIEYKFKKSANMETFHILVYI